MLGAPTLLLATVLGALAPADILGAGQLTSQPPVAPPQRGIVMAAPHGRFDRHTDEIAAELAARLGTGLVVARGFRHRARPVNVNRPTEGIPPDLERGTARAQALYEAWGRAVARAAGGPLRMYIEI